MYRRLFSLLLCLSLCINHVNSDAQTWTTVSTKPTGNITLCLLLTDGGVMCQAGSSWYKLTPSNTGSYASGSWSTLASFPAGYNPDAFASAVLADGRVAVMGGEYQGNAFTLSNSGAIYSPVANAWTMLSPPASTGSPNHWQCIGDAPAVVLADGRWLLGTKLYQDLAVLDPRTLNWSSLTVSGKVDTFNSEEGFTLLPDGSVFAVDVAKAPAAERLLISNQGSTGQWVSAGNTPQDLHTPTTSSPLTAPNCPTYNPPGEMGPLLLLPSGQVFAVGANGNTGIYTPPAPGSSASGNWTQGPVIPGGLHVEDGPGVVLPNGHVLFGASPGSSGTGLQYFEFDGSTLISVPAPARASWDATYYTSLLPLPNGQVLLVDGSTTAQLYTPSSTSTYQANWAPTISNVPNTLVSGSTYTITGYQFNGLTQASAYGDESQNATGYPLVRITNTASGHVFYARTHDHSTMAIATGNTLVSTSFDVPANIEAGPSTLQVVANGIPSASVAVNVTVVSLATNTTLSSSLNPSLYGQTITLSANTSANGIPATGTVRFMSGAVTIASANLNNSGQASATMSSLPVGNNSLQAIYSPTGNFSASASATLTQTIHVASSSTKLTSSRNPALSGMTVTLTATVSAASPSKATPTGSVTFKDGAQVLLTTALNNRGQATLSTIALSKGTHLIGVTYSGDQGVSASATSMIQVVQ